MGADQSNSGRPGSEEYVGTVWQQNANDADLLARPLGHPADLLGKVMTTAESAAIGANAQAKTTAWANAQAGRLEHGLETQSVPHFGGQNYASRSTTELHQMVNTNMDPAMIGEAGSVWNAMGNTYSAIAQSLGTATSSSESGWTGAAGDATRQFLSGMASFADVAGQGAQLAGNRLWMQSEAAQTAKNSMPTPVEPPNAADVQRVLLQSGLNPAAGAAQLNQQFQAAQQAHVQAVQAVQTFDTSLANVGDAMPAFRQPPTFQQPAATATSSTGATGIGGLSRTASDLPATTVGNAGTNAGAAVARPSPSSQPGQPSPTNQWLPPAAPNQPAPTTTTSSAFVPPSPMSPAPVASIGLPGPDSSGGYPPLSGVLGEPVFGGGAPAFGQPGAGTTGGLGGGRFASGGEPGARVPSAGEPGSGSRSGVGGAGVAEEAAAIEHGAVSKGGTGIPGLAGMGGHGGKKDEEKEHRPAAYLKNPDPNETFGTDQKTVPPTIGE
jgi:hypothetical protein